jgi:hypothetical protein
MDRTAPPPFNPAEQRSAALERRRQSAAPLQWQTPHRMKLELGTIVPEALHRQVGWDIRHHFMAEKTVDRFALALPRDRELIRQLAVVYVLEGRTKPPDAVEAGLGPTPPFNGR